MNMYICGTNNLYIRAHVAKLNFLSFYRFERHIRISAILNERSKITKNHNSVFKRHSLNQF